MAYVGLGLVIIICGLFMVCAFFVNKEKKEAERTKEKQMQEEKKRNETKEKINGGNHTDNINNILDLL